MPGADESAISEIETRLFDSGSASSIFEKTGTPQAMLKYLLEGGNPIITSVKETGYRWITP